MPEPAKPESVPPATAISAAVKLVDVSLSVNVIVAVCPALSDDALDVIAIVGATVSIAMAGESEPAALGLPAASVNAPAATETVPAAVESVVGVNVAE